MYREICSATLPASSLARTIQDWDVIARRLAESKRNRTRYTYS
jgi:hypothetical protein